MRTPCHRIGRAVVAALIASLGAAAYAEPQLNARQTALVESGGGSFEQQVQYIGDCFANASCEMALIQVWQNNGKEMAMSRYLPPESQVPALFRNTDVGRKMRNIGALAPCAREEACRAFLVEAVKAIRALPPEQLKLAYQARVDQESAALGNAGSQIKSNLQQALAQRAQPAVAEERAPAPAAAMAEAGGVIDFARDPYAKVTVQLVKRADGNREIQRRSGGDVKRLAMVMGREGKWLVELADGTQLEAADLQLTGRGFVAGTVSRPVSYSEETGLVRITWPSGFHTASVQRGNVAQTGYLLLERDGAEKGSADALLNSFAGIGASLGMSRKEDYLLMDLHSGRTYPLNIRSSGKDIVVMSNCRAKNAVINVCRDADTKEALYDKLGKNMGHYAWVIYWFRAPGGTYLAALEDGLRNVTVTRLETGDKRIAFSRGLGIRDFSAAQDEDGRIRVDAQIVFEQKRIDDLELAFESLPKP